MATRSSATRARASCALSTREEIQVIDREMPTPEGDALIELAREITRQELAPLAAEYERACRFPRHQFRLIGKSGLLGLPYSPAHGGGGQPYSVYLQVLEELATGWMTLALGLSVHTLSAHALAEFGTAEQRDRWLPDMLEGELLGAYCLSEHGSGSDAAAMTTTAVRQDSGNYLISGTKAWITHGGEADYYTLMARTATPEARPAEGGGRAPISCFLLPGDAPGLSFGQPERKMGLTGSTTAAVHLDRVNVDHHRLIGSEGQGFRIAMNALDSGRLGIAACAVGLAQAAVDASAGYAKQRHQFGQPIARFQGIEFMLADMATQIEAARSLYLAAAARKDAGRPFSQQAAMAKLFATDMAMTVTTDAVQILGGAGYVADFPVERYMREAKVLQIVEGTNQIQRVVIARSMLGS